MTPGAKTVTLRGALALMAALPACGRRGGNDAGAIDVELSCAPLAISPSPARAAPGMALYLRATGGSGHAVFTVEGEARGTWIEPGGGLHAGEGPAQVTVVARDGLCALEARTQVDVVGAFDVQPDVTHVAPGGTVRYESTGAVGTVSWAIGSQPMGAGTAGMIDAMGVFSAGTILGTYSVLARDTGSGREARLSIEVGAGQPVRPFAPLVALPVGGRVRLDWRGSSVRNFMTTVAGPAGGRVAIENGAMFFDAAGASAGHTDVTVTDRFTGEIARVRVLVGDAVGPAPIARGANTWLGAMASGDVNGDGRADLIVGHAERSRNGPEAGGVLVYYGASDGSFPEVPGAVIEGESPGDHFGAALYVGDVNGDAVDDVIVGAPERDLGDQDRGVVQVHLGATGGLDTVAERVLLGTGRAALFGTAFLVQDVTGDGTPELVVSAPGAVDPGAPDCHGGQVYVYRRTRADVRGVFEALPWQIVNVRDAYSDDAESPTACTRSPLSGGSALALIDMDSDGVLDLAVGAPAWGFPNTNARHGSVLLYRGGRDGVFEAEPGWSLRLAAPARTGYGDRFGAGLDVVRETGTSAPVLVVRAPGLASGLGGFSVFAPGSLGAPGTPGPGMDGTMVRRVRTVSETTARARYVGADARTGVGRSAALGDVDGDGRADYVLGSAGTMSPGSVQVFPAGAIVSGSGTLTAMAELTHMGNEGQGSRIAVLRGASGQGAGLASWAADRDTPQGLAVGAVDYAPAGPGAIAARWDTRRALALPGFGAGDFAGARVALGDLGRDGTMDTVVSAPGAHSPMSAGQPAGSRSRSGVVEVVPVGASASTARVWNDRDNARTGDAPVVLLDFDGDGALEVAIADPAASSDAAPTAGFANPDECRPVDGSGSTQVTGSRGVVRIYSLVGGALVERFWAVPPTETERADMVGRWFLHEFGARLSSADTNGDGRADLVVGYGRHGDPRAMRLEVVPGRAYGDASNRVVRVCAGADDLRSPDRTATPRDVFGEAVAGVGDVDGDGCDDVASSITKSPSSNYFMRPVAGVMLLFGYNTADPARCGGHGAPFDLRLVVDGTRLANNVAGDDSTYLDDVEDYGDLEGVGVTRAGHVLPLGAGDVTGDGVDDVVFRDALVSFRDFAGVGVEVISGALLRNVLATHCPGRACSTGRAARGVWLDGGHRVLALSEFGGDERRIVPAPDPLSRAFATAISLRDLTGDGAVEIALGTPDDSFGGSFAGAVRVWRGGAGATQDALLGDPWLVAVGNVRERGSFGASLALAAGGAPGAWLAVGAPQSTREGLGGQLGAVYRWRIEAP